MKHAEIKLYPALRLCGDGETREKFYDVECKKYFQLLPPYMHAVEILFHLLRKFAKLLDARWMK